MNHTPTLCCSTCEQEYNGVVGWPGPTFFYSAKHDLFFCNSACRDMYYLNPLAYENTPRHGHLVEGWSNTPCNMDNLDD